MTEAVTVYAIFLTLCSMLLTATSWVTGHRRVVVWWQGRGLFKAIITKNEIVIKTGLGTFHCPNKDNAVLCKFVWPFATMFGKRKINHMRYGWREVVKEVPQFYVIIVDGVEERVPSNSKHILGYKLGFGFRPIPSKAWYPILTW